MDLEEYRRTSLETWDTLASGWERRRERIDAVTRPVSDWLVDRLDPEPGQTILELAAGPGTTGFAIADRLGDDGRLISTDFSPDMIEVARRRAAELGLANVEFRVLDAEGMDLDDDSFDGVVCRFGYMLMADPAAALEETRRVLRPGGRLTLGVWHAPERNPWAAIGAGILVARGHMPPPEPGAPSPFAMGSEERTRALLEDAGLTVETLEEIEVRFDFRDVDDYAAYATDTGGPFAMVLRELPEEEIEAIKAELGEAFAPFASDGGYELPGVAIVATAR